MATLTTSWQSLGSATLYSGITVHLDAKYSSQSTANNTSSVQFRLRSVGTSWRTTSGTAKFTGAYTDSKSCATYPDYIESGDTIFSISKTVKHNDNGTKSISIGGSVQAYISGASRTATISNKTATLPKINRLATVTSTDDFTDEENPTLSFNNPAGFTIYPYLNFYDDSNTLVYQLIRNTSSATSPYVWNITDAERTALRKATNKQQTYKVNVGVDTYNGTTKLGNNSLSKTMRYVNSEPSQSTTFTETNQKVIDVLGADTAEMIIQNVSQVKLTTTPVTKKEATVSKISFEHNNISADVFASPYEYIFTPVNSKFKVTVNDSRKYSISSEYTKSIVEYVPIDISSHSFKRESPTSSNIILNAEIRYKQTKFGSIDNTPSIQWKLGTDGELTTLTADDYTIDANNNKITISNLVLENVLPYTTPGKFSLYVNDLLTEDKENDYPVTKGIPTCDMGEHDFQVNGELYVADENRENKVDILDSIKKLEIMQNAMTIGLESDTSYTASANYFTTTLPLTLDVGKSGTLLTRIGNGIKIGKNISKVLVTGNVITQSSTSSYGIRIANNNTYVAESFTNPDGSSNFHAISLPPIVIDVAEGDTITLLLYINDNGASKKIKSYSGRGTYLTVNAIQ